MLQHHLQLPWILNAEYQRLARAVIAVRCVLLIVEDPLSMRSHPEPDALSITVCQLKEFGCQSSLNIAAVLMAQEIIPVSQHI